MEFVARRLLVTYFSCVRYSGTVRSSPHAPSVQQISGGLNFSKSRTGSRVTYSCHHISSRFTFPIFVHLWRFITINHAAYILIKETNTFA